MSDFRADNGWVTSHLDGWIVPLAILTGAGLAFWLIIRHAIPVQRLLYNSPKRLFEQLCHAHRLDWTQRRLLRRLAKSQGLENAARLFLEPDRFAPARLPTELAEFREPIARLCQTLFHEHSGHIQISSVEPPD